MKSITVLVFLSLLYSGSLLAEGMTKEQGDAILQELRAIRQELQELRQDGVNTAAQPQANRKPQSAKVATRGNPILGDANAPVTMIEYTDFQCPYCRRFFSNTLAHLRKDYIKPGKLRLVLVDLPLDFHSDAMQAARAAHCAGEQDKYWQMHDAMFSSKNGLKRAQLENLAGAIGLNRKVFRSCLDSGRYNKEINRDIAEASSISITGTPSFVIGRTTPNVVEGKIIQGAQKTAVFVNVIDDLLKSGKH